ncbi:MAG: SusC/RagA family TonB-linked outer membrane protein [Reichenbachiella sp.]|uniref:SusC/RagA family TonB-linked outer membrane protein n=2 Tax=Reichenbachiella sp. TaxID=2184521 RepID=UPI0032664975
MKFKHLLLFKKLIMYSFYGIVAQLICCTFLFAAEGTKAQSSMSVKDIKVNVKFKNDNLISVFNKIEQETDLVFVFNKKDVSNNVKINSEYSEESIYDVLLDVSKQSDLSFQQVNKNINVKKHTSNKAVGDSDLVKIIKDIDVTGKVIDESGQGLPGAAVTIKGTNIGAVTDLDGMYKLSVPDNGVLIFSFVGFVDVEVSVGSQSVIDVTLKEDVTNLSEVVVTALGFSREKKSLTYSAEEVSGEELTRAKDASFINALAGKSAGIQINRSGSGVGGSTRVILRGNSSTSNNKVLYVIDGVPMVDQSAFQPIDVFGQGNLGNGTGGAGRDGGDGISNINPEDIESMTVLKGASAAALYGSQGANGVILITTKSGKSGKTKVTLSSNFTSETANLTPDLQYKYGQTAAGSLASWGPEVNAPNHVDDFFRTGKTWINSVSLSGGNEHAQTYFSYANTNSTGIMPGTSFEKHNVTFKETAKFLDDKLTATASVNLVTQEGKNRGTTGLYYNPLTGLYQLPRGLDFENYKNNFETYDSDRLINVQNWHSDKDTQQNPYWIINRNANNDSRDRVIANATLEYELAKGLKLRAKGTYDRSFDFYEQNSYASTQATLADANGRYVLSKLNTTQKYGEAVVSYSGQSEKISYTALVGTAINDIRTYGEYADSKGAGDGLQFANKFSIQNIAQPGATFAQSATRTQVQSVFASANIGYNGMVFLDATVRNDWASTLAFTGDDSFLYPSIGLTGVISEMIALPNAFDLLKARVSYAKVGSGLNAFDTAPLGGIINTQGAQTPQITPAPGTTLRAEDQGSFEFGIESSFLSKRVTLDFTYYNNKTKDQRFSVVAPSTEFGVQQYYLNGGDIQNKGIELGLGFIPVQSGDFQWSVNFNYTKNKNEVVAFADELDNSFYFLSSRGVNAYAYGLIEGEPFGVIFGQKFARTDDGRIIVDATGVPQAATGEAGGLDPVGNINPDFTGGISNTIDYKDFSLNFLIDFRVGGEVLSLTESMNDELGVSKRTQDARDNGFTPDVALADGSAYSGTVDPAAWFSAVGGRAGITENYIYSATNVRLRELSLSYALPVQNVTFIQNARLSIVGRNLFFLKNDAPFDPDLSMSTGIGLQGVDTYALPSTRSFGVNLSVTF